MSADATSAIVLTQPVIPDLAQIGEQLNRFREVANELTVQGGRAIIASEETFKKGTDFLSLVKTNKDQVEALRKVIKKPIDNYAQLIQDTFLPVLNELTAADKTMRDRMVAFRQEEDRKARVEQERVRKEQEAAALKRAEELEAQGKTKAADAVLEMAAAPLAAPQKTEGFRGTLGGKASTQETWSAEIVNMREFLTSVLAGTTNFNLDAIQVSNAELNRLAKTVKVECTKNGVKIKKSTGLALRG